MSRFLSIFYFFFFSCWKMPKSYVTLLYTYIYTRVQRTIKMSFTSCCGCTFIQKYTLLLLYVYTKRLSRRARGCILSVTAANWFTAAARAFITIIFSTAARCHAHFLIHPIPSNCSITPPPPPSSSQLLFKIHTFHEQEEKCYI